MSNRAPDSDPLDEHDGNAIDVQVSIGNDSSGASKDKLPSDSAPNDLNSGSLTVREPELQITTFPDEKIGSDDDSDDQKQEKQENDDDGNSEQTSVPAQLRYIEALESLRSRLGSKLCPEDVPDDPKSGASALKVHEHCPSSPTSEKIEVVSKINSRIQGDNPIEGSPFDSYPKRMGTNGFPSLNMKPKVFGQDSYKITDPTLELDSPPIDPSFREVLKQGASLPSSHSVQLQQLDGWERLARAVSHKLSSRYVSLWNSICIEQSYSLTVLF